MISIEDDKFDFERFIAETISGRVGVISANLPETIEFLVLVEMLIDQELTEAENRDLVAEINENEVTLFIPFAGPFGGDFPGVNGKIYDFTEENCEISLGETELVGFICQKDAQKYSFKPAVYSMGMCGYGPEVDELTDKHLEYFKDDFCDYLNLFRK